jgi:cysteine-rich repeat protein
MAPHRPDQPRLVQPRVAHALVVAVGIVAACEHGWDAYDPRLAGASSSGGAGGSGGDSSIASGAGSSSSPTSASGGAASSGGGRVGPLCGDGTIEGPEECDDSNQAPGDGCHDCSVQCSGVDEFEDPLTHACYWHGPALTWPESVAECEAWGGFLATVTSQAELDFVRAHVAEQSWLGGNEIATEGAWVWDNGETWSFEAWNAGEPNDANGKTDEDCLEFYDNTADAEPFGFADADCPQIQRAICERPAPGS